MISEYDSLLEQARTRTNIASKDYIPKCCEILKKQGLSNEDITKRIRRDFKFWGQTTIYEAVPEEYKKQTKPKKIPLPESILLEQSSRDSTRQMHEPDTFGMGVVEMESESKTKVPPQPERDNSTAARAAAAADYDKLANEHNELLTKYEGLEASNEYLEEQQRKQIEKIEQLGQVVQALQTARPNLVQITPTASKVVQQSASSTQPKQRLLDQVRLIQC